MKELIEKITKLCQGNPGALTILKRLLTNTECIDILEQYNICGSDIWQLYKDCCHENIDLMTDVLNNLPSENIKYHINHGHRGIEYDKNIRNGNVDDWIKLALKDLKEYNIYARMGIERIDVLPSQPPEPVGEWYSIYVRFNNHKTFRFNNSLEQMTDMNLNNFISYILSEIDKICKHNLFQDTMKLDEVIDYLRGITDGWKTTNAEYINGSFLDTCCKDHLQLMEWLMELKQYRMKYHQQ